MCNTNYIGVSTFNHSVDTLSITGAADFLAGGGDLATLQKILGHSNIATTMIYTHVSDKQVADAYRKYGPGANNTR